MSYAPPYLTEKILDARPRLEGERKQATALFADSKDSTELIEGLDPEEACTLLDPALHAMLEAVHRYEGTVNQVLGDGIMALFEAPMVHGDYAARSCYAALAMQAALRRYGEAVRHSHGLEMQIRVGRQTEFETLGHAQEQAEDDRPLTGSSDPNQVICVVRGHAIEDNRCAASFCCCGNLHEFIGIAMCGIKTKTTSSIRNAYQVVYGHFPKAHRYFPSRGSRYALVALAWNGRADVHGFVGTWFHLQVISHTFFSTALPSVWGKSLRSVSHRLMVMQGGKEM